MTSGTRASGLYTYTFSYNARGQRIQRNYTFFPGTIFPPTYLARMTTTYKYDPSGRLVEEAYSTTHFESGTVDRKLVYLYEGSEKVGLIYTKANETGTFYYDKNPRGDVIGILDSLGNTVVKYKYDAFGNCNRFASSNVDLAYYNPIRYRSYYYDEDIGLYFLNARYYNPAWRRFISPDNTAYLDYETPNGLNLYAYCNNDPVNYYDPSGCLAISLTMLGLIIGAVIGATVGGIIAYNTAKNQGAEGWELFGWTMLGVVGGGVIGGALGYGAGALITHFTGVIGVSITKYSIIPVKNITLLGHLKTYRQLAQNVGAGVYYIITPLYDYLKSKGFEWTNNLQYLIDANSLGTQFVISPEFVVLSDGTLWQEIHYLISNNIPWIMP